MKQQNNSKECINHLVHMHRWEALLIVMDNKPFPDLHHILQEVTDDRVWVFAEWVSSLAAILPLSMTTCEEGPE